MSNVSDYYDNNATWFDCAYRLGELSGNVADYLAKLPDGVFTGSPSYNQLPTGLAPSGDTDPAIAFASAYFEASNAYTNFGGSSNHDVVVWLKQPIAASEAVFEWYLDANNHMELWYDHVNTRLVCDYTAGGTLYESWSESGIDLGNQWWICQWGLSFAGGGAICQFSAKAADGTTKANGGWNLTGNPLFAAGSARIRWGFAAGKSNWGGLMDEACIVNSGSRVTDLWDAASQSAYIGLQKSYGLRNYWPMQEGSNGLRDVVGSRTMGTAYGTPNYQMTGPLVNPGDFGIGLAEDGSGLDGFRSSLTWALWNGTTKGSFNFWWKRPTSGYATGRYAFDWTNSTNYFYVQTQGSVSAVQFRFACSYYGSAFTVDCAALPDDDEWHMITFTFDAADAGGTARTYVDGVAGPTAAMGAFTQFWTGTPYMYMGRNATGLWVRGHLAHIACDNVDNWTPVEITALYDLMLDPGTPPESLNLPMRLEGFLTYAQASLPMQLNGAGLYVQQSIGMSLQGVDPNEGTVAAGYYDLSVILDGTDLSSQLVGATTVEHQERTSGLASFQFIPNAGVIDPDSFERKTVTVDYRRVTSTGTLISSSRRFTGISSSAYYDPDTGIVKVEATTDLQGTFENMDREAIKALIPNAQWSEHIFDNSADGWKYAQDLLSTTPEDCHVSENGSIRLVPWAAKSTADLELLDDAVIDKPISLTRAKRRDLLTRIRINLDFRFVRLRHREMSVQLPETYSFCEWLNLGFDAPGKSMVQTAADSSTWTRTSDISFNTFPAPGVYCTPPRGWVGGAEEFCLRASWKAARRWAQTVTEEYSLYMYCPDLEESVGKQEINEDYGIEATYDATDYEKLTEFTGPPTGAVLDAGNSEDWTKDATDSERDGRLAMEDAQRVALAKASTTILDRARRNQLTFDPVYNPVITMDKTLRLNTTHVQAKGKVHRLREKFDTQTGEIMMRVNLALSRHGGTGLASNDPQDPAPEPPPPTEQATARVYILPWRMGGLVGSPVEDPTWDGYFTNPDPNVQTGPNLYEQKLIIEMPEIEEAARNATAVQAEQFYELIVPEDELTMSY